MTEWKLINSFHIPQEVWDKAEVKAKEWGWTVEAVLCDSLEKSFCYSEREEDVRFVAHKHFLQGNSYHYKILALKREDKDNDFVGNFTDIRSKQSLIRIAKNGYGISEHEILFIE